MQLPKDDEGKWLGPAKELAEGMYEAYFTKASMNACLWMHEQQVGELKTDPFKMTKKDAIKLMVAANVPPLAFKIYLEALDLHVAEQEVPTIFMLILSSSEAVKSVITLVVR